MSVCGSSSRRAISTASWHRRDRPLPVGPVELDAEPRQSLPAQRTVRLAEPLQRFIEQADELGIALARIADPASRRHRGARERLGPIGAARQFDRLQAGLARLREIAGPGLSLAELAHQLGLQRIVAVRFQRQRVDRVAQMLRRLFIGELPLRRARGLARIMGCKLGVGGRGAAAIMEGDFGERR